MEKEAKSRLFVHKEKRKMRFPRDKEERNGSLIVKKKKKSSGGEKEGDTGEGGNVKSCQTRKGRKH